MAKTTFRYALTFESQAAPPLTIRGEVEASSTQAGARLAVKDAMFQTPGRRWTSLSLMLERPTEGEARQFHQSSKETIGTAARAGIRPGVNDDTSMQGP
jgi:hypothetical protein